MAIITFNSADATITLRDRRKLKQKIHELFTFNNTALQALIYVFCSDEYLLNINRQFLHHDYYTDIVTFDLSDPAVGVTGEVYISVDRVKENAHTHGVSMKEELHRVIFHGALHLCGFKDKNKREKVIMKNAEDFWIQIYFSS